MTIEHRVVLDFTDLRALRVECTQCHGAIAFSPSTPPQSFAACPACGTAWIDSAHLQRSAALAEVVSAIATLLRTERGTGPVRLRLEYTLPADPARPAP